VEGWLNYLGVSSKERGWRAEIFERMGSDPANSDYVRPAKGDVWDFIGSISQWLRNPARKGIPI